MGRDKEISWLYEELPSLVEKGLLTEEAASKLRNHYGEPEKNSSRNLIFIISAILGSILIGLGIILLFAYNWDEYSRLTRTIITFIPLIAAELVFGYAYFRKRTSIGWMEGASGFLFLMVGAAIGLTGQIYNMGGTLSELLLIWILVTLPLLYLANTVLVFSLYMILLSWWSFNSMEFFRWMSTSDDFFTINKIIFLLLALAVVPFLFKNIDKTRFTARGNILGWVFSVPLFLSYFGFLTFTSGLSSLFYYTCLATIVYALGKLFYDNTSSLWQKPMQVAGITTIFLLGICFTFKGYWGDFTHSYWFYYHNSVHHRATHLILYLSGSMFLAASAALTFKRFKKKIAINYFPLVFPIIIGIGVMLAHLSTDFLIITILCNLFILGYGIYYIYNGIKLDRISLVNAGMLFLSILIAVRFISSDAGFLMKGIIFILLGSGFLAVNYFLLRKQKKNG